MKDIKQILARSKKATCGITEREIAVRPSKVKPTIRTLEKEGFHTIGTSYGNTALKKIWFIRRSGL